MALKKVEEERPHPARRPRPGHCLGDGRHARAGRPITRYSCSHVLRHGKSAPTWRRAQQELAGFSADWPSWSTTPANWETATCRSHSAVAFGRFEYLRQLRDVDCHRAVYDFLSKQLEASRIDEAKVPSWYKWSTRLSYRRESPSPTAYAHRIGHRDCRLTCCTLLGVLLNGDAETRTAGPNERARLEQLRQSLKFCSRTS